MTGWREVALGEGIEVIHGYAFKGEYFRDEGDLIVLTPGNFWDKGGFKPKSGKEKYYDGPFPPRFLLSQGDVVIAMTEQVHGLLGSSATIPTDGVYLHNQRIGLVQVTDPDALDLRFVYHLMNTRTIRQQIQATATGSKVRHTAPERIKAVRADIPDIAVQRRVASLLDSIDDLIENNRRRVEVLEEMARAIYREWFVRFRYPGHEHVPLVDSPLGPIPDGWRFGRVEDLVTLSMATVDPSTVAPSTPAVGLEHIPRQRLTLADWGEAGALGSRKATFVAGDILFGKIRPYFHKVSVAPVNGVCSTDAIVLRPHAEHWGQAVLAIASDEFVAHAVQTSNGTKMPRADWKVIREFPVAMPPSEMARRFSERAHALLAHAQSLMFQARHLASLRDLLLPKLVTGQIDVSQLNHDALTEAASA
jgi:type I restriction enzyme S subunit